MSITSRLAIGALLLATFILIPFAHGGNTQAVTAIPDLRAFWDFAEAAGTGRVSEPGGHVLTDGGSSPAGRVAGGPFSGYAASFDGAQQFFTLPAAQVGALNIAGAGAQVTVVAWVKRSDANTGFIGGIWQENNNDPRRQYGLFVDLPTYGGAGNVCGHVSFAGGASPGLPYSRDYSANRTPVLNGRWHTIAFTFDGAVARSFIDGKFETRPTYTEPGPTLGQGRTYAKNPYSFPDGLGDNGGDFTVGAVRLTSGMGNFYGGQIGGLAVFERALTARELFQLHVAGLDDGAAAVQFAFRNITGANAAASHVAWSAFRNATVDAGASTTQGWVISNLVGLGGETGYLAKTTTGEAGIAWTDSVPAVPTRAVERIEFRLNNALAVDAVHLAVRIGGAWFVGQQGFSMAIDGATATNWATRSELKSFSWTRDARVWRSLVFDEGSRLTLLETLSGDLPAGEWEAIGFYQPANAGMLRIDLLDVVVNAAAIADPVVADPSGDPDGDGVPNLLEHALGGDPAVADASILPRVREETTETGKALIYEFSRCTSMAPVTATVEVSADLENWRPAIDGEDGIRIVVTPAGGNREDVVVTMPVGAARIFVRLRASW